jgi:hypothetical protein
MLLLLVAATLLVAGATGMPAVAQSDDEELGSYTREQRERLIRERIRQVFLRDLRARVDVTDEQMRTLLPLLEDMEAVRMETVKRRRALTMQLRGLVEDPQSREEEIERKLADLHSVETEFAAAEREEQAQIEGLLSPRQQAQLLVFREEFRVHIEAKMSDLRREMRQRDAMRRGRRYRSGADAPPGSREERP